MIRSKAQVFNDGVVTVYTVSNISEPGNMPKQGLVIKLQLRYKQRTIGNARFYDAMQNNARIDALIRVQTNDISAQDVAVLPDGRQFVIDRVQTIEDIVPPVMDLTLRRLEQNYDIKS